MHEKPFGILNAISNQFEAVCSECGERRTLDLPELREIWGVVTAMDRERQQSFFGA